MLGVFVVPDQDINHPRIGLIHSSRRPQNPEKEESRDQYERAVGKAETDEHRQCQRHRANGGHTDKASIPSQPRDAP